MLHQEQLDENGIINIINQNDNEVVVTMGASDKCIFIDCIDT